MTTTARRLFASAVACCLAALPPLSLTAGEALAVRSGGALPNPILFVTQMPIPVDFATIGSTFANHLGGLQEVGRGGDLYIRYPDGSLRNLTQEAGYGVSGFQGATAIAVRNPAVHWSGTKAVFSMVIGAPTQQFQLGTYFWQLYEVSGLGQGQTAVITKVPNQPAQYNNVMPIYGSDGRILFVSDRPRSGAAHLYPQLDEYEETATNTGLWSLDPATGNLNLLDHSPSGVFTPILDRYGRVLFTRWDHLQRDQQADTDVLSGDTYGTFNYADESAGATRLPNRDEVFPEPRPVRQDLLGGTNLEGHTINHFFPWQVFQNGTGEEVVNHLGRHELHAYFNRSINDDPNLEELIAETSGRVNPNSINNFLHLREDVLAAGTYLGVDAPEFQTHSSGQLIAMFAPPGRPADQIAITYLTHPDTRQVVPDGQMPPPNHSGHYRSPLPLADGEVAVVHAPETHRVANLGTRANPVPNYRFRLRLLTPRVDGYFEAGTPLTAGISKTISYWDPDVLVQYNGELWELDPVEVRPQSVPPYLTAPLPAPEAQVFREEGVNPRSLSRDLATRGLALLAARNVTYRDQLDHQQPFNLLVPGGEQTLGAGGRIYQVAHMQLFQGDQIRGLGGTANPRPGRRVLAQLLHDPVAVAANPPNPGGPLASTRVALDGSVAAFVPAHRALSWQTTDGTGTPVVRERYWLTFQPGELRACDGCHGVNSLNQAGEPAATNAPEALRQLLQHWKAETGLIFSDGFESGDTSAWASTVP